VTVSKVVNIPARPDDHRRAIGSILIDGGHLSPGDADAVERFATETGLRFGEAAVQLKLLSLKDVQSALAQQFNYPVLLRGGEHGVADDVVAAYDPQNDIVEPLRALRSQLMLRWLHLPQRKALAITSPNRGDGRSWLAANLATVFAQGENRTLLIDTDMRHPSQHRLFNVDNAIGLSALLTGRAAGRDVIRRVHPSLRLYVLPAGILPPNPQELLVRPIFNELLARLSKMFEVVILDTPAAMETADAQILAARAGAAVVLVRRNRTRVAQLTAMTASLTDTGASVIGTVANDR
jgi:chain length determinant protein tyrosine kinase EpsG